MKIEVSTIDFMIIRRAVRTYRSDAISLKRMAEEKMFSDCAFECDKTISKCDELMKTLNRAILDDMESGES